MNYLKLIILAALLCPSAAAFAQTIDSTLIEVQIEGIPAGKTRMIGVYGDRNYIADSAVVDATGRFEIRRKNLLPTGFYTFLLPGNNKNFSILIDKDQRFKISAKAADIGGTMQVDGSLNTDLFYKNYLFQAKRDPELNQVAEQMRGKPESSRSFKKQRNARRRF